ncbi:MAG: tetratricopeptide repeat protein [Candidatus Thorarchaeota archaeon]
MKDFKAAIIALIFIISFGYPQSIENLELRKQANTAYHNGEIYEAIKLLNQALINDSTDALAFFNLANIYLSVPNRERAIKNFTRSINLDSSKKDLLLNQFIAYSGLSSRINNLIQSFRGTNSSDSSYTKLVSIYMNKEFLEKNLKVFVNKNSNIPMFVDYFIWLGSPLGLKLFYSESGSNNNTYESSDKRRKLFSTLDEVTGTTKSIFNSIAKISEVLPHDKDSIEVASNDSEADSAFFRNLKDLTLTKFLANYSYLSDNEINELIDFYNSDIGQWLIRMKNEGYDYILHNAITNIFKEYKS